MRARIPALEVLGPMALVVIVGLLSTQVSLANEQYFLSAIISVAMVVAVYVFVGNSGVLSFGQISFVAVGGFASGVMTIPVESKSGVLPELFPVLRDHTVGMVPSLVLAALVGGVLALVLGLPLMRLSGLAAGIATFAVLEITNNILNYETRIGPALNNFASVPATTGMWQAAVGAIICIGVAYAYQRTRFGRMLRATREDERRQVARDAELLADRVEENLPGHRNLFAVVFVGEELTLKGFHVLFTQHAFQAVQ